jgi:hypothetical protein
MSLSPQSLTVIAAAFLFAAPAFAQPAAYYAAKPASAPAGRVVVRDLLWNCSAAGCVANNKGGSRATLVCESLVKQVGKLEAFRAGDQTFDAAALERCNAKA